MRRWGKWCRRDTEGSRGLCPALPRCPGAQGVCNGQDPSVPGGGGGGWSPTGGRERGTTALCCVAVHGVWEEWSPWSLCSVTCGRGSRTRTRRCVAPRHGGKACEGPELQAKSCNIASCPGQYLPLSLLLFPPPGTPGDRHRPRARAVLPAWGCGAARDGWHRPGDPGQPVGTWVL